MDSSASVFDFLPVLYATICLASVAGFPDFFVGIICGLRGVVVADLHFILSTVHRTEDKESIGK